MTKEKRIITLPRNFEAMEQEYCQGHDGWSVSVTPDRPQNMRYWLYNYRISLGAHGGSPTEAIPELKEVILKCIEECVDVLRELETIKEVKIVESFDQEKKEN